MNEQSQVLSDLPGDSSLRVLVDATIKLWPEHKKFLSRALVSRTAQEQEDSHEFADLILKIAGARLPEFIESYRWMCKEFSQEQLHFSRTGSYRFSRLNQVESSVYGEPDYMTKYMDGLLISQIYWSNHRGAASLLKRHFFSAIKHNSRHLEIGPGHGLFMYFAAKSGRVSSLSGWDISETSLKLTQNCLDKLGVQMKIDFSLRDAAADTVLGTFDSLVLSEVLEHVEDPLSLLRGVAKNLSSEGRIFINVPVNSPAPDHIYLFKSPTEVTALVAASGLKIIEHHLFPETGMTVEQAKKRKATISCVVIARP
jgi:2-polyprenyl-3-methyl-5-hydroxy-6-metoxy-1,4-benzoquinol methylase